MTTNVEVITHFFKDDTKFLSDSTGIDIIINGQKVISYGYYDSHGRCRANGFLDGLYFVLGDENVHVKETKIADYT